MRCIAPQRSLLRGAMQRIAPPPLRAVRSVENLWTNQNPQPEPGVLMSFTAAFLPPIAARQWHNICRQALQLLTLHTAPAAAPRKKCREPALVNPAIDGTRRHLRELRRLTHC